MTWSPPGYWSIDEVKLIAARGDRAQDWTNALLEELIPGHWHGIVVRDETVVGVINPSWWAHPVGTIALEVGRWPVGMPTDDTGKYELRLQCLAGNTLFIDSAPPPLASLSTAEASAEPAPTKRLPGPGRTAKYDWEGAILDATLWLKKYGIPETNAELERHVQAYFERQDGSPSESLIRERVSRILKKWRHEAGEA